VGLDVFPDEPKINPRLLNLPNTTLLPHVGTENQDARRKMEVKAITNLRDFITCGRGKNLIVECQ
jgi:lactate dehydrogenase-like 2-hydroxyacid dehydrogenase